MSLGAHVDRSAKVGMFGILVVVVVVIRVAPSGVGYSGCGWAGASEDWPQVKPLD